MFVIIYVHIRVVSQLDLHITVKAPVDISGEKRNKINSSIILIRTLRVRIIIKFWCEIYIFYMISGFQVLILEI